MSSDRDPENLNELFDKIEETVEGHDGDQISLEKILDVVGRRSFGPLLLITGILPMAPIPVIPTISGIIVFLISIQLLFNRSYFWLPGFLLNRSLKPEKLGKAVEWMRRPADFMDRIMKPRLTSLSTGFATNFIAVACMFIALFMPMLEVIPFSAMGGGAALTLFGLALITRDGLLSLIAFLFVVGLAVLILLYLL